MGSLQTLNATASGPFEPPNVQGRKTAHPATVSQQIPQPTSPAIILSSLSYYFLAVQYLCVYSNHAAATHKPDMMIVLFTGTRDSSRPASVSAVTVVLIAGAVVELKKIIQSILPRFTSSSHLHKREREREGAYSRHVWLPSLKLRPLSKG